MQQLEAGLIFVEEEDEEGVTSLPLKTPDRVAEAFPVPPGYESEKNIELSTLYALIGEYANMIIDLLPKDHVKIKSSDFQTGEIGVLVASVKGFLVDVETALAAIPDGENKFDLPDDLKPALAFIFPKEA